MKAEEKRLSVGNGATAGECAALAGIPLSESGVIERDGTLIEYNCPVADGDTLIIHPLIVGG